MKKFIYVIALFTSVMNAQVGIGTSTPDNSSVLDIKSTTNNQGVIIPILTKSQISSILSPATGLSVYNSDDKTFSVNIGTPTTPMWKNLATFDMSNTKPTASAVTITGNFTQGGLINGNYTYADTENDPQNNSTGVFYIADDALGTNAIATSTTSNNVSPRTYTLLPSQTGKFVAFGITPSASSGNSPGIETITGYNKIVSRQVFAYSGSNQTFVVPAGVTTLNIKMWGAGGAGGFYGIGGTGAYVSGTLTVTPGQTLTLVVGQGGTVPTSTTYVNSFGGGGSGGYNNNGYIGGGGGGRSAIVISGTEIATAGGGGGGGGYFSTYNPSGGGGGSTNGNDSSTTSGGTYSGKSGTSGGAAGAIGGGTAPTSGSSFLGGRGGQAGNCGGGGGGGYFGGGGGTGHGNANLDKIGGGGGGSSYTAGSGFTGTNTAGTPGSSSTGGTNTNVPGNTDIDYVNGIGNGGTYTPAPGGNGLIVITY